MFGRQSGYTYRSLFMIGACWALLQGCAFMVHRREPDPSIVTDQKAVRAIRATGRPWSVVHSASGIELLMVPSGTFAFGADNPADGIDLSQRQVTIKRPFYLSRTEVTQEQWAKVMGGRPVRGASGSKPARNLSWGDVQAFLKKTGLRLPTESQWEYACRAGLQGQREGNVNQIAWHEGNSPNMQPQRVGTKRANSWGFHDMLGNVWEYCSGPYSPAAGDGVSADRVARGCSSLSPSASVRCTFRVPVEADKPSKGLLLGFRVMVIAEDARKRM